MSDIRMLPFEVAVSATMLADIQISPDGKQVAYVTTAASVEGESRTSAIWIVDSDGGKPRRLTTSEAADGSPRWSPDGSSVAFLSDRLKAGSPQAYVIAVNGGEAVRLTNQDGPVTDLDWSPDGKQIAFTSMDGESPDEKRRKEEREDWLVVDADLKRATLWVIDVPEDPRGATGFPEPRRISPEGLHVGSLSGRAFSWAPDSKGLAAIVAPGPKADFLFSPDLATFDLDGTMNNLGNFPGLGDRPLYSPDGSTLGFIACEREMPSLFSLRTIPAGGGDSTVVLPDYKGSFTSIAWLPEGDRMLAMIEEGQQHAIRFVDIEEQSAEAAFTLPAGSAGRSGNPLSVSRDGSRVAFARANMDSLADLYVADVGGTPQKVTDLNPWIRDYDFGEMREVSWKSTDGMEIEGLLILPVGYEEGQRYPLLLHIHGGPCGAWTSQLYANWHDWGQFLAQRGYAVLMPNPRGSSGQGSDFLCAIVGCYGEPDWDDLITGVDSMIEQGIADPERLVVGGWSGGGFLTNWTITHSDRFKAAVSGAGIANWVSFQGTADVRGVFDAYLGSVVDDVEVHWRLSPIRVIGNAKTPTLILYGAADARVPPTQGYELYEGLKALGVETQLVTYPREPHTIGERKHQLDLLQRVVDWYDRHLGIERGE